ncbi:WD repeat-containing protein 43-like [Brevipalpus obovatus]|uniref:WD repeat-containing protein 43-like n=1 Tax=Brevipalpus obovatus TaxID=246614 RepID=UPI003D9F8B6D
MSFKGRRKNKTNSVNNKIIEPLQNDAQILGPGQMAHLTRPIVNGVKLRGPRKRKHVDSQSDGLSLDEMMTENEKRPHLDLNFESDDGAATLAKSKDSSEIPKTDSLCHILVQGLQSQNERMIQTALQRSDPTLIRNTINSLPNDMIEPMLTHLHKFFFYKGEKNRTFIQWLEQLMRIKLSIIITTPSIQQQLASIRELLLARCEIYERVYMLKGKLNLITDQIDKNSSDKGNNSGAKIVYNESSSEDEESSDDKNDNKGSEIDSDMDELEKMNLMELSDQDENGNDESGGETNEEDSGDDQDGIHNKQENDEEEEEEEVEEDDNDNDEDQNDSDSPENEEAESSD